MEEYKSFIRFANLYLYFYGWLSTTFVGILREKSAEQWLWTEAVGQVRVLCGKSFFGD
ncbi:MULTISPECIES: hypothetical protein [unclassified Pseudomonas]|uniref:hypothetical protein n=1 Tax=unclassified Pseudomonas TaxID=196821 RepID=UPI001304D20E|nr:MULTISPECIES: hypothetical protein [unclassified Pseudomonas]